MSSKRARASTVARLRERFFATAPSDLLRREERRLLDLLHPLPVEARTRVQGGLAQALLRAPLRVETPKGPLLFAVLGHTAGQRAKGLLTKQPATIAWIDTFRPGSVFWDIGANVGSYALYAALRQDLRVVAFEPAAVNHFSLSVNAELNGFGDRLQCLQIGVGARRGVGRLDVSQLEAGLSFGFRENGKWPAAARQATLVVSIDELVEEFGLPSPHYVKIDVPGMTGAIVEGASRTLQRPDLRELHIEASEESVGGRDIVARLAASGFRIVGRHVHGQTTEVRFARPVGGGLQASANA